MGMTYRKVKTVSKVMMVRDYPEQASAPSGNWWSRLWDQGKDPYRSHTSKLDKTVLDTMKVISDLVGSTLGPGGHSVLLERQEHDLPNFVTKDGVTVFRAMGFHDPIKHAIMEAARDASVRTASEAGDGTTTATILAYSIVKNIAAYTARNPSISPQKIIRKLQDYFKSNVEPSIREHSTDCEYETPTGKSLLRSVARLSANGDGPLADAVMNCLEVVGDQGNVTITEISGPSSYEIEHVEGFPINVGYEDSCGRFYSKFINDPGNQRVFVEKPIFLLFHGRVTDIQSIVFAMERIGQEWQTTGFNHNVVLVATGYSESVLAQLAMNWAEPTTINVFPLLAPMNAIPNSQYDFLLDLSAITGAKVFDPLNNPLPRTHEELVLGDLGGTESFEATRFRSTVVGQHDDVLTFERADILEKQLAQSGPSTLEASYLQERIGKLTGGIAKLKVIGASNGELRERRDRAEDAIMAVRKSIEHGCLPGGGWMLAKLVSEIDQTNDPDIIETLGAALAEPFFVIFRNLGYSESETWEAFWVPMQDNVEKGITTVYDAQEGKWTDAFEGGILDSTPAVLEAIRNSLSIATLLGTLGGVAVFPRDTELERQEARDTAEYLRTVNDNPANERL